MVDIVEKSDVVSRAQANYKRDIEHWKPIYDKAREDLIFLSDDDFAQWDPKDYQARVSTGRPALTIDQLGQFVHQVSNDIRQNTPSINIIPAGSEASQETAEVFKGLIRNIEYVSGADEAYDTASLFSVKSSIGFIRVDHDYCDDESSDQELLIKSVKNPFACMIDSLSQESDGCDAKHGYVVDRMLVADFKKQYPDKEIACFENENFKEPKDSDFMTVCEYFEIKETTNTMAWDDMGQKVNYVDGQRYAKTRNKTTKTVMRYKLSGKDVLEETTFPGKYIPLIPVYGEEAWLDGKRNLSSLIRKSKGAQKMYNYWKSLETELLMKQPQAPIMVAEGQIEDYAEDWLNPSKAMALRYKVKDVEGNPVGAPQRLEPPTIPTGIVNASRQTVDDIKATMGLYNASIGARSNETSGIAIQRRQQEGDVATFHFADNLNRSIAQVGRIIVCAIPEIYDTPRVIRIIGEEEEPQEVGVNGAGVEGQEEGYDLTKGKYDVRVVSGAPYTTRRQEAAVFFTEVVKSQPDLMQIMGDLLFKNMDFTGAEAMAERMKKLIKRTNPDMIEAEKDEQPAPDPEKMQMAQVIEQSQQAIAQMQQKMQSMQAALDNKQGDLQIKAQSEAQKAEADQSQNQLSMIKMRIDEEKNKAELELKVMELQLRSRELDIQEQKIQADIALKSQDNRINELESVLQQIDQSMMQPPLAGQEIMGQP